MTAPDVFRRVVHALDAAGIPYMLTGSFASAYHAVPRATQDIDLVIAPDRGQLAELARAFSGPAYYCDLGAAQEALERESLFNVIDLATGWKIDFIIRKSREYSRTEFARRQRVAFEGLELYIATAEDVLLSKLEWAKLGESGRQLEDAAWLLRRRGDDLDFAYLERWVKGLQVGEQWETVRRLAEALR
ncbi:MAG: hypothetical protein H0X69_16600 [Gemmatimonadales bacterium]|nr:hypothetical protein [Gemmatimonadales bacterium]